MGGILANNTYRADFIYENLQIQNDVIHSAYLNNVKKLLFLGTVVYFLKIAPPLFFSTYERRISFNKYFGIYK